MGRKRKGRRKRRSHQKHTRKTMRKSVSKNVEEQEREKLLKSVPRVLVFRKRRKNVGKNLEILINSLRKVFNPYTLPKLKIQNKTTMKQLVDISKNLYVSDFLIIGLTETGPRMRFLHLPNGPTFVFKIESYSLIPDVHRFYNSVGLKYDTSSQKYKTPATSIFKNFEGTSKPDWLKLVKTGFEGLFPKPLEIPDNEPKKMRRCVLFSYDDDSSTMDIRHYQINFSSSDTEKKEKEKMNDEDDDEEEEEEEEEDVEMKDELKSKNCVGLSEIGPRLRLKLEKIEEGFNSGEVLYHAYFNKSEAEVNEQRRKLKLKETRRRVQEENVERKLENKREKKLKKRERLKKRKREALEELDKKNLEEGAEDIMFDEDDDIENNNEESKRKKKKRKIV